jgi:hypothetical protein
MPVERRYHLFLVEPAGARRRVFATAVPTTPTGAQRALAARLAAEFDGETEVEIGGGEVADPPRAYAGVIAVDGDPATFIMGDDPDDIDVMSELVADGETAVLTGIIPVEVIPLTRRPRLLPGELALFAGARAAAGITRIADTEGGWCPRCSDARCAPGVAACAGCLVIEDLTEAVE